MSSKYGTPDDTTEHRDDPQLLESKIDALADLVRKSKHLVVYTGAGISTSAKIPDFRGPQGVWTRADKGLPPPKMDVTFETAQPTPAHMALVQLQNMGIMKYLVSQNVDGLHLRSGIRRDMISELHGNTFIEECSGCKRYFLRDFDTSHNRGRQWPEAAKRDSHATGRNCEICGKHLRDSIIHFGENLPQEAMGRAILETKKADVIITLGTSLRVSPACDFPRERAERGGKLVICNFQETPLDEYASLKISGHTDAVMEGLLRRLNQTSLEPPMSTPRDLDAAVSRLSLKMRVGNTVRGVASNEKNQFLWTAFVQPEDDFTSAAIQSVDFELHPTFSPSNITVASPGPYEISRQGWGTFQIGIVVTCKEARGRGVIRRIRISHDLSFEKGGAAKLVTIPLSKGAVPSQTPVQPASSAAHAQVDTDGCCTKLAGVLIGA